MTDFNRPGTLSITCPRGFAPLLQQELGELGYPPGRSRKSGVELKGSLNDAIRLNFHLRTAHRIHRLVAEKRNVDGPDTLYEWLRDLPWEEYIPSDGYLTVTSRIDHSSISNSQFANVRVKDAVVDRMRERTGQRPDSGPGLDRTVLFLYWDRKGARIFLDTSGESLSRRGYRSEGGAAPMQESLAAAILLASKWNPDHHLVNPMCGSGTIAIEAALMAMNRPPASLRHDFGFMHIAGYEESYYLQVRDEARKGTVRRPPAKIIATDSDPEAVRTARRNARTAGVDQIIEFDCCPFEETRIPEGEGAVILNPPYGERLRDPSRLEPLYGQIGDFLKQRCEGKTGYVFTGNFDLARKIGLRTSRRVVLFNSTIECRLLEFELYRGSRA